MNRRPRVRLPRLRIARPLRGRIRVSRAALPGIVTLGNLLGGFAAILAAAEKHFLLAVIFVFAAAVFDALDGRIARLTGSTSEMGEQLDSLCDAVSFAVAPSIIVFHMGLQSLGRVGYAACFLYAACGVLRLARFNVMPSDHHYFTGLPIPSGAATVLTPALLLRGEPITEEWMVWGLAALVAGTGLLMVSRIRYRTFKDIQIRGRAHVLLPLWAAALAGLVARAEIFLPALLALYLVSPAIFALLPKKNGAEAARRRRDELDAE
ncbi:MAG: CDP-diacylglycerol--serine O-phosphatidyltransferase [Candidatus Polarisedimenticolia bacterium]|nr:CDP-diacylglycerol--serine O-phosphatidyltransferase [bacterium]